MTVKLFRLWEGQTRDPAVDSWLMKQHDEFASLAPYWFDRMRACGDDVLEMIHDGCPVACVEDVPFGYVNVFTAHMNVGFFLGALLPDPRNLLQGTGKRMRHVKLGVSAKPDEDALDQLIVAAYEDVKRRLRTE